MSAIRKLNILLHDYGGHAFCVQLSRELASRGHRVDHVYASNILTPQGSLARSEGDAEGFRPHPIKIPGKFDKNNPILRRRGDIAYGKLAAEFAMTAKPDLILCGNSPLDVVSQLQDAVQSQGGKFVFWVQDLFGQAAVRILGPRYPVVGKLAGLYMMRRERRLLSKSDGIVVISEDFKPFVPPSGLGRTTVIENWASILTQRSRDNAWAASHGLTGRKRIVYSGTLGMKHNPGLLVRLAQECDADVVVVSEGKGADWIKAQVAEFDINNLKVLPFQSFDVLPDVLGSADLLVTILEPDAGVFSVPSKVLSYLCSDRAILLSIPPDNLAARNVLREGAGLVVAPSDVDGFIASAKGLLLDDESRSAMGHRGRAYAEQAFDIRSVADRFEEVFALALGQASAAQT